MRLLPLSWAGCLSGLALLAGACQSPPATDQAAAPTADAATLLRSGFEESLGWGGAELGSLTTAQAHTGRVAVLASPEVPFSYTYARTLDALGLGGGAHRLELTAWVRRTASGSTAQLVAQLNASPTDEAKVYYAALPVAQAVPRFGEWQQVRLPVALPAAAQGGNQLRVYLWNDKGTSPTYLDDVALRQVQP